MCAKKVGNYSMDLSSKLGRGSYGDVFLGQDLKTGIIIAIKQISLPNKNEKEAEKAIYTAKNEIHAMRAISDKNVVKLIDMIKTQNNIYLMLEYCNGGSLDKYIQKKTQENEKYLAENEAKIIMRQIIDGYKALYKSNIVHRDLKPANILIHDGVVKIADFGFSKFLEKIDDQLLYTFAGSPLYMSPQILQQTQYTLKADIWSLGVIFFEILFGRLPWTAANIADLLVKIKNEDLYIPEIPIVSQEMKNLLQSMLQKEECNRICWKDLQNNNLFNELIENLTKLKNSYNEMEVEKDNLRKSNMRINLYFQEQNVVQHVFHAEQIQDQIGVACPGIIIQNKGDKILIEDQKDLDQMYKLQKEKLNNQVSIQTISDWVVHRKNKSAFLSSLISQLYEQYQQGININKKKGLKNIISEQLYFGFLFILTKYQTLILFKMKRRIQTQQLDENHKKFQKEEWKKFCKSKDGQTSLKVIERDFQVINQYFDSMIPETIKQLKGTTDKMLQQILLICNKNQIEKQQFNVLFQGCVFSILQLLKQHLQQNSSIQLLRFSQHLQNSLYMNRIFKFNGPEQIDFFKYYQKIENFNSQQILQNLKL